MTNDRVRMLLADFSGLEKVEEVVEKTLKRLQLSERAQAHASMVKNGRLSLQDFDGWFAELVRVELGKTLGIVRAKAVEKASIAGAGSAASAVMRRMYRSELGGNVNIVGNRGKISSRDRVVPEPNGGKSGIRRPRTVKDRTMYLRKLYGPDRSFILRILDSGRDVFMATPEFLKGRGSKATWGKRGAIAGKGFFHNMGSDMEQAAQQLGSTLIGKVEQWVEQQFEESIKQ